MRTKSSSRNANSRKKEPSTAHSLPIIIVKRTSKQTERAADRVHNLLCKINQLDMDVGETHVHILPLNTAQRKGENFQLQE